MEFYGSEATILTKAKIHKTYFDQHCRSIFALLYVKCLLFKPIGQTLYGYYSYFDELVSVIVLLLTIFKVIKVHLRWECSSVNLHRPA